MKLFIAGTDTGVGKTWVSAAISSKVLAQGKSVVYYKPVQTGVIEGALPEDPEFVFNLTQGKVKTYCSYCFNPPVAPYVADTEGTIDINLIISSAKQYESEADILLIEGAGGLAVPLTRSTLMIDLIKALDAPVLLVSRSQLGAINHTLLSVEALTSRNIPIAGIVFNFYPAELDKAELAVKTLLDTLRHYIPKEIPLWTSIYTKNVLQRVENLKTDINIEKILDWQRYPKALYR